MTATTEGFTVPAMIIVTGGAGFIGSNLVARLVEDGLSVCVVDHADGPMKRRNLARWSTAPGFLRIGPEQLDDFLVRRAREVDTVYHLGAITSTTETDVARLTETNVRLPQSIWRWCARHDVPLVYASSAATYGDGSAGFADDGDVGSLSRLAPINAYGRSKHAFDLWAASEVAAGRPAPPRWHGLKFFNVYGPNEYHKGDMRSVVTRSYAVAEKGEPVTLFRSHRADYPDGGQKRDFVYVRDCVEVMRWIRTARPESGLYNVGTGRAQTWLELMTALYATVGHPVRVSWVDTPVAIRESYQYFTQADISRLRGAGYDRPFADVEAGVDEYVTRYLSTSDPYR